MMSEELSKRADALRARFKVLEGVPGSGYHDGDRNQARNDLYLAPQKNGLSKASEHLVCFTDQDEEMVYFAGSDADKAWELVTAWYNAVKSTDLSNAPGTVRKLALRTVPRLSVKDGILAVKLCDWNDVHWILEEAKVGLHGQPFRE